MSKHTYAHFRIPETLKRDVAASAMQKDESMTEAYIRLIEKAVSDEKINDSLNDFLPLLRKAVRDAAKPAEDRLASISAKTNIQAGTALYLMLEALDKNNKDISESYRLARKKAIADLKQRKKVGEDDE